MAAAFRLLKSIVSFLVGAFVAAIIAYYVGKYLEKHDLVDVTSAVWSRAMTLVDDLGALLAQPWFWPAFCGLTSLAIGLYLDAFMRRWAATFEKKWLSSYKIFELADPNLMKDAEIAEDEVQQLSERINQLRVEREKLGMVGAPPGYESAAMAQLRDATAEASARNLALQELRERARRKALDDIYDKLRDGRLIARGFKDPLDSNPKQIDVPAEYWRFLKFSGDYQEAHGKGVKFTAIVVAR